MDFHPIANIFPLMEGEAFAGLVADIRAHGLLEPVTTYEGKILDGRNRERACREAGIAPRYVEWAGEGGSPARYVWSKNAERRQLTVGQKALAGVALMPWLEQEAKERLRMSPGRPSEKGVPISAHLSEEPIPATYPKTGRARVHAARLAGVGPSAIQEAKHLTRAAETDDTARMLRDQVQAGIMPLNSAMRALRGDPPRPADPKPPKPAAAPVEPPAEETPHPLADGLSESTRSILLSRPLRILSDRLGGLRREMRDAGYSSITQEAIDAWWEGAEQREWETLRDNVRWLMEACGKAITYVRWKDKRNYVPPTAVILDKINKRANGKQRREA